MRVGVYAQNALRVAGVETRPVLAPLDWLRLGTLDGARALGLDDASARSRRARRPTSSPSIPAFVAAARRAGARRRPGGPRVSRLIFRAHPDMVRGAWVRGRRLGGPGRTRLSGV